MAQSLSIKWIVLIAVLLALVAASILSGSVSINMAEALEETQGFSRMILLESRLPRTLTAVLAGAALSVSGLFMQTLFRNPLAGPSVLGVSSGASLFVAILTMSGVFQVVTSMHLVFGGIIGSLLVLLVLVMIAKKFRDLTSVLIVGIMLSFFTSAIVSFLSSIASTSGLKAFVFWGFGSFADLGSSQLSYFSIPVLLCLLATPFFMKGLNALLLGESHAKSLGVNPLKLRRNLIFITGVLTGTVTAFCGPIAFIGLAAPHIARFVFKTANHRTLIPASLILGSLIALLCDLIARLPGTDYALPLNTVCALMGAPVVIYLIFKGRNKKMIL
jgi:iron complex transport system permease protein